MPCSTCLIHTIITWSERIISIYLVEAYQAKFDTFRVHCVFIIACLAIPISCIRRTTKHHEPLYTIPRSHRSDGRYTPSRDSSRSNGPCTTGRFIPIHHCWVSGPCCCLSRHCRSYLTTSPYATANKGDQSVRARMKCTVDVQTSSLAPELIIQSLVLHESKDPLTIYELRARK